MIALGLMKVKIINNKVFLDGMELKNTIVYKLENTAYSNEPAKLEVVLYVATSEDDSEYKRKE